MSQLDKQKELNLVVPAMFVDTEQQKKLAAKNLFLRCISRVEAYQGKIEQAHQNLQLSLEQKEAFDKKINALRDTINTLSKYFLDDYSFYGNDVNKVALKLSLVVQSITATKNDTLLPEHTFADCKQEILTWQKKADKKIGPPWWYMNAKVTAIGIKLGLTIGFALCITIPITPVAAIASVIVVSAIVTGIVTYLACKYLQSRYNTSQDQKYMAIDHVAKSAIELANEQNDLINSHEHDMVDTVNYQHQTK